MAVAGDVPRHFDVVINGEGYMFMEAGDQLGESGYSPLFVDRQNTQGAYGDAQFDFWLTYSQNDWSLGAFQRYVRTTDQDSKRQFWLGKNANVSRPGQVSISRAAESNTVDSSDTVVCAASSNDKIYFASATKLYSVSGSSGAEADGETHGVGNAPTARGIAVDGSGDVYLSAGKAESTGIRATADGSENFTSFSATGANSLAFLNNALYGYAKEAGTLYSYATDGTATALHTFRGADGAVHNVEGQIVAFGPRLMLMLTPNAAVHGAPASGFHTELWEYNGVGVSRTLTMPRNFVGWQMEVFQGSLFVSGYFLRHGPGGTNLEYKPAIYVVAGGREVKLWEAYDYEDNIAFAPSLVGWDGKLWFPARDPVTAALAIAGTSSMRLFSYDPETGAISPESNAPFVSGKVFGAANQRYMFHGSVGSATYTLYPHPDGSSEATAEIQTSLFDGDSTLQKHWESVQVEFDDASDGNGGTVNIERQFNSLEDGGYTTIQNDATSGTEYNTNLDAASRELSLVITLNKGTSTRGPVLKAVRLRGSPINPSFRRERYVLNLHSVDGEQMILMRNGQLHPDDGLTQAKALRTAFTSGDDFSVTDEFGTYNAVFEPEGLRLIRTRSQEYVAVVRLRES